LSIKLTSAAWTRAFTPSQQLVMQALCDHANDDGSRVFPGLRLIAGKTGYSERQAKRIIAELLKLGAIVLVTPATRKRPNEYRVNLGAVPAKPSLSSDKMSSNRVLTEGSYCPNEGTSCPNEGTFATGSGDICDSNKERTIRNHQGTVYTLPTHSRARGKFRAG
jgi:hypothetical protein